MFIKLILFTGLVFANGSKLQELKGPYSDWTKPEGASLLQCDTFPDNGKPQDKDFKPKDHNWPTVGGIKQNELGPYRCGIMLPDEGLTVGGGRFYWATAGGKPSNATDEQKLKARESRRGLSSAQKFLMLRLEAANPNWAYNLEENGIELTPVELDLQCVLKQTVFVVQKDGKDWFYYRNYYRYLGVKPEYAGYIPTHALKDYLTPDQLKGHPCVK